MQMDDVMPNSLGLDEVGRGPLAGPVLACAVMLTREACDELSLRDSKKTTKKQRDLWASQICKRACAWGVGLASVKEIDRLNIRQATMLAMRRAVVHMPLRADHAYVDGRDNPGLALPVTTVIGGDAKNPLIAAASIVAKVWRDSLMASYAELYPEYGFDSHSGYGTAHHLQAMARRGVTPIHRQSFKPVARCLQNADAFLLHNS
jgi:ribonuclease HII